MGRTSARNSAPLTIAQACCLFENLGNGSWWILPLLGPHRCFDILHVGHITLLEQCRKYGDKLIVAINSDASVQSLKGSARPVVGESERARVLAALASTDAVTIFSEQTPINLIRRIRPDVLVKGGDYTTATVVGAEDVISWGGRVEIVATVPGYSTSNTIARMKTSVARAPLTTHR